eukprot:TRINITY_DN8202_c0_g1_i15.p1 TRINITY_DN8202_c0_g1~~TRINITY_DN8202_c0_g1_i15.p1  ORF type:complete len:112 (+),score=16.76 TRINITY_DN8202_c0_g1_i15:355-690(+)
MLSSTIRKELELRKQELEAERTRLEIVKKLVEECRAVADQNSIVGQISGVMESCGKVISIKSQPIKPKSIKLVDKLPHNLLQQISTISDQFAFRLKLESNTEQPGMLSWNK